MGEIAFIGIGAMGARMARRLLACGFAVTVHDRDPAAMDRLAEAGAMPAPDAAACAGHAVVILMVATGPQLEAVADALAAAIDPARPPRVLVMSTVDPATMGRVAAALGARGARVIDAPVSGGVVNAEAGTLSVMAGGAGEDIAAARPVLDAMARSIFHCGPLGAGQGFKILNNLVGITNLFLSLETAALAQACGIDPARLAEVMEGSSGRTHFTRDWPQRSAAYGAIAADAARLDAHLAICRKDLRLAAEMAAGHDLALPLLHAVERAITEEPAAAIAARWQAATR